MSQEESEGVIRTVTKPYRSRSDSEMSILGLVWGLLLLVIVIPLIPFIVVVWVLSKFGVFGGRTLTG